MSVFVSHSASPGSTALALELRAKGLDKGLHVCADDAGSADGHITSCAIFLALIDEAWITASENRRQCMLLKKRTAQAQPGQNPLKIICVFLGNTTPAQLSGDNAIAGEKAITLRAGSKSQTALCNEILLIAQSRHTHTSSDGDALNIIMIGDSAVGKSSLMARLGGQDVSEGKMLMTIGVDMLQTSLKIGNRICPVKIWDTAGQERFNTVAASYFRRADAVMVVYDVTSHASFLNVGTWLGRAEEYAREGTPALLVGNKCDLAASRAVTANDVSDTCAAYKSLIGSIEVSAISGHNVTEAYTLLAKRLFDGQTPPLARTISSVVQLGAPVPNPAKAGSCCQRAI